ncbi:MAG TPA: hypothetical protein VM432_04635 [Bdellovibrionales bacterium]|nr:hypothetical protein [Bdellovibrionales bacterium]
MKTARWITFVSAALVVMTSAIANASAEKFLKSAWSDGEVVEGKSSDYDPESAWSPFREVEVFTSTEVGEKDSSFETGLDFQVKSFRELSESWKARSSDQGQFVRDLRLQLALQRRYLLLVEYFHTKKLVGHLQEYGDVLDRNFRAQGLAIRYGKAKAQDLLKAQVAVSNNQREMRDANVHFDSVKAQIREIMPDFKESSFNIKNFVTPEDIANQRRLFRPGASTTTRRVLEMQLSQLRAEQNISLGRQGSWFKGFKVAVEDKPKEVIYKASLSFKLPFLGDDLVAIQSRSERLTKVYEKARELELVRSTTKHEPGMLKTLLDSYAQINQTLKSLARVERSIVDPQVALDTVLSVRSARSELIALEKEILIAYIDLLYEQGVLQSQPDVNHLSATKTRL